MRILFSGDVAWNIGRRTFALALPVIKAEFGKYDFLVINCENAAHGKGMTEKIFNEFIALGVDGMTSGNHIWNKAAFLPILDSDTRVFRPANYARTCPGTGCGIIQRKDRKLGIINLQGQAFMPSIDSPFECADKMIERLRRKYGDELPIFVDFHAEATAEKQALGHYLDGRVSAVVGTHTHVQTADEKILRNGTAFITDAGMTGGHGGVIGVEKNSVMPKFLTGMPTMFEPCESEPRFNGVMIDVNDNTGLAEKISRINLEIRV